MQTIQQFHQRAQELEQSIKALLLDVRSYLDEHEAEADALFTAESDLYDAMECLQDFSESCESILTEDKPA